MREIKLTQGKVTLVNDEDFEWLNQFTWHAHWDGYNWYARRHLPRNGGYGPTVGMHRVILNVAENAEVDHRDGDSLNNVRSNLRVCTHGQNMMNSKAIRGASRFKGITWNKSNRRWKARISIAGMSKYLGCFESEEDAAIAYNLAAKTLHGDFARINASI